MAQVLLEQKTLLDAHVQARRIYNLLTEVLTLTRQLAEATDRNDQVTIRMLVSMRADPIDKLRIARRALEEQQAALSAGQRQRLAALLNGEPPETEGEKPLSAQVASNARLLEQVLAIDKNVNHKLTRDKSVYR